MDNENEGRSDGRPPTLQDVARAALREYVARRGNAELVDAELQYVVTRYADALRRLGDA